MKSKMLWIVCHGYGQLAEKFIRFFEILDDGEHYVLAPEGLSKFYLSGFFGDVGASWMTREDRLAEIKDQHNYLDAIYHIATHKAPEDIIINVLGFSQGAATVCRWLANTRYQVDNLIVWAGEFPRDIEDLSRFGDINLYFVYGLQDEFIKPEQIEALKKFFSEKQLHFNTKQFDGKHRIDPATLKELSRYLVKAGSI